MLLSSPPLFFSSSLLFLLLLLLPLNPPLPLSHLSIFHSSVRVLGVAVLSRWPVPTLTPSLTPGRGIESQVHWKAAEVTAHHGPGGWCSESRWVLAFGKSSLGGCWPLRLPSPPDGKSQVQNKWSHFAQQRKLNFQWLCGVCCSLTCPGVLSVGSGPWWNSRWSFPEWRSNTNCLNLLGTLWWTDKKYNKHLATTHESPFFPGGLFVQISWICQALL